MHKHHETIAASKVCQHVKQQINGEWNEESLVKYLSELQQEWNQMKKVRILEN